jgi:Ser/Thr protein kinase RdoA (MazF antagonist)
MPITLELDALAAHAQRLLGQAAQLNRLHISELAGGQAGAAVYRIDLRFDLPDGTSQAVPVVYKVASEIEVRVMRALRQVQGAGALPYTISSSQQAPLSDGTPTHWFVTPLYTGEHLTFEDEVPRPVVESLARVHAHFGSRLDQLGWLPRLDGAAIDQAFGAALHGLEAAGGRQPHPLLAQAHAALVSAGADPAVRAAFAVLPRTLTHGDVHPWNIVRLPGGRAVLIDWGNARLAPPMLDLANLVEIDSENWEVYLLAWSRATAEALDPDLARLGYHWATVMINLQYLPYTAGQWLSDEDAPVAVSGMVGRLQDAVRALSDLLS